MDTLEITQVNGSSFEPYEDAHELPSELRHSLSSMKSKDKSLKRRVFSIQSKLEQYGKSRPCGSYMDPRVSDIHIRLNSKDI